MGAQQSSPRVGLRMKEAELTSQPQRVTSGYYDGPYFGGHQPGDFTFRVSAPTDGEAAHGAQVEKGQPSINYNKPLPPLPEQKSVRWGERQP